MADKVDLDITRQEAEEEPSSQTGTLYSQQVSRFPRKRWMIFAGLVLAVGLVLLYWLYTSGQESTDDAQIDAHIHSISARVSGIVTKLSVSDNQYVEAGTVLLEIDPADFQVIVDKAKADLAEAEAELRASQSQVPIVSTTSTNQISRAEAVVDQSKEGVIAAGKQVEAARSRLQSMEAQIRQAKINSDRAAHDLERFRTLAAKEEISRQQFDTALAEAEALRAHLESVEAQLQEAQQTVRLAEIQREEQNAQLAKTEAEFRAAQTAPQQVEVSHARVQSAQAKVARKKADLEQALLSMQYTVVKAPLRGIISQRTVEVGQMIQTGQPLLAIVPLDDIWVTANFKENQLARMHAGQAVTITVDTYGRRKFKGVVDSLAAATGARFSLFPPENATGNYVKVVQRIPVKIVFEKGQDPEHLLRPGMSVIATVQTR